MCEDAVGAASRARGKGRAGRAGRAGRDPVVPCRLKYRAYGVPRGCISSATLYLLRFRDMFIETQAQGVTRKYSMRIRSLIPTGDTLQIVCTSAPTSRSPRRASALATVRRRGPGPRAAGSRMPQSLSLSRPRLRDATFYALKALTLGSIVAGRQARLKQG